jgi:peptidoglycan/LPS O-acetylase OafA/YrhL
VAAGTDRRARVTSTPTHDDRRLAHIDSLRAIAAMLVVWMHVSESLIHLGARTLTSRWVFDIAYDINAGRLGVATFFAISGFVVPFSIKLGHPHPVGEFLVKRACRLYPAYWLSVPLGFFCLAQVGVAVTTGEFLVNLTMLQQFFGVTHAIGLYWTLTTEIVFYACCIALVLTRSIRNYRFIAAAVIALVATHFIGMALTWKNGTTPWSQGLLWLLHIAIMFWGMLYRAHLRGEFAGRFAAVAVWGVAAFLIVPYPLLLLYGLHVALVHTIGYSLGLALFIIGTRVIRVDWRPLAWLGVISYSIYLFHPVVRNLFLLSLRHVPADSWWRSGHLATYVAGVLLVTIAFAALVHRFIERPGIALGRRIARRWLDEDDTSPPVPYAA